jgi:hypothetical protein
VIGQLHVLASLTPRKLSPVPNECVAGWAVELVLMPWRRFWSTAWCTVYAFIGILSKGFDVVRNYRQETEIHKCVF